MLDAKQLAVLFIRGPVSWNSELTKDENKGQEIDLRELQFHAKPEFKLASQYHFPGPVVFDGVNFPDGFCIDNCTFPSTVSFRHAILNKNFCFRTVTFGGALHLPEANLPDGLKFDGAQFE